MESPLIAALTDFLQKWGELDWTSALVVASLIVALSLVPIPRSTVNIAVCAVFGFPIMPVIMLSNAAGAALAFLLARYFFFDGLQRFAHARPRLRAVMNAIDAEGWRIVALLRLGGPLPGVVQNYLYGLTRIPLWACTVLTLIFTIPQIWVHLYLGAIGREALEQKAPNFNLMVNALTAAVVLCVIALLTRRLRAALRSD